MKTNRYILITLGLLAAAASAQTVNGTRVRVTAPSVVAVDNREVMVGMDVTLPADLTLSADRMVLLTPVLRAADSSASRVLPPVAVYGRRRYIADQRMRQVPQDAYAVLRRTADQAQTVNYAVRVAYAPWMDHAALTLQSEQHGCARCTSDENEALVAVSRLQRYQVQPVVAFVQPEVETVKRREEEGRAYLDFPVNQTDIRPDYRRNPEELAAIRRTVDAVSQTSGLTLTAIHITGYASPEGSYAANARLAQRRAEALRDYVREQYGLPAALFTVTSVPEDWQGLRDYVAQTVMDDRDAVQALLDDPALPDGDEKERRLRQLQGGRPYARLLADCYPRLRHSDYVVRYIVRGYDVDEARALVTTRPQLLSLQEMYAVAQTETLGTDSFNNVFEVAVRMFPDDPTANVNAAALELRRGQLPQAARYLDKADPQAAATLNNLGVYHLLSDHLDTAEAYFRQALQTGSTEAEANLSEVARKREDEYFFGRY